MIHRLARMLAVVLTFAAVPIFAQDGQHGRPFDPPMAGIQWAKGQAPSPNGSAGISPNLIYHGGNVMSSVRTTAIFWGSSWGSANFTGDKMTGLADFYSGMAYSAYAGTVNEYTDSKAQVTSQVTSDVMYSGAILDLSPAKSGNATSPILAEVCKAITNPVPNGYYPVYVDLPRRNAGFCAWHSAGTCNGTPVQFAFFFNLDGDRGCDPQDTSGLHSQGLAALANVSGHEISEARNDPHLNAWYDNGGSENADKCAWTFGDPLLTFSNNSKWKIQGNWSNNAFDAGKGYPNSSGQKGCVDGLSYPIQ